MLTEGASLQFLLSPSFFPECLVGAPPSHHIVLVPLWNCQGTLHLSCCWLWLCSPNRMSKFSACPTFVVIADFSSFLPSLILPLGACGHPLMSYPPCAFFAILLCPFLSIISKNIISLPRTLQWFGRNALEGSADILLCIHLPQPLIINLLKNWSWNRYFRVPGWLSWLLR